MSKDTVIAADLFCGAGGTSAGLARACASLRLQLDLLAINHWQIAIDTHSRNHPAARHLCESLDSVDPRKVVGKRKLQMLIASPECTHHSIARGGRPMSDQSRASAWHVVRWAEALSPESILIENVREFQTWGPIGSDGRPLRSKRGQTFQAFLKALESLGYAVDYRLLNAANYGDATSRERLFIQARRGRRRIAWPEATHLSKADLFAQAKPWRTAREIIDWSLPGESIFTRKRQLSKTTLARIEAGLRKFGGKQAEAFLIVLRGTAERKLNESPRSVDRPLPTITTSGGHVGLCQPFIVPFFGERDGQKPRCHSIDKPLPTVTGHGAGALIEPFILPQFGEAGPRSVDRPLGTITTTSRGIGLVEPFIVPTNHGRDDNRSYSIDKPMQTITSVDAWGLVQPFLVKYHSNGGARSVGEPLDTVTTRDRFGLVTPDGQAIDIRFRMLQPHELARAMGFDDAYQFAGTREAKVKQIGNAVPVNLATALCRAMLA